MSFKFCFIFLILAASCGCKKYTRHPCAIPRMWSPVCGTDGKTYSNKWAVRCRNFKFPHLKPAKIAYEGECGKPFYPFLYPPSVMTRSMDPYFLYFSK